MLNALDNCEINEVMLGSVGAFSITRRPYVEYMLTCVGIIFGTSGKQNLWISQDEDVVNVSLSLLTTVKGDKNGL